MTLWMRNAKMNSNMAVWTPKSIGQCRWLWLMVFQPSSKTIDSADAASSRLRSRWLF